MIELSNISFHAGKTPILNQISVCFQAGEHTTILGPNGAGKSTLLRIAAFGIIPTQGTVRYHNQSPRHSESQLAKTRAFMSQHTQVPQEYTVEEVVGMGRYPHFKSNPSLTDTQIVSESMRRFALSDYACRSIHTLSGGEQQRVHLARAYAQLLDYADQEDLSDKFLFLDEPLNNLDIHHQYRLIREIETLTQLGLGVISVFHDINLALACAHRVILVKDGAIYTQQKPEEITARDLHHTFEIPFEYTTEGLLFPAELTRNFVFTQ